MASSAITFLLDEIIEYILEDEKLDFQDIVKFSLTCKHLHKVVNNNNKLWRNKFFQRWPCLRDVYRRKEEFQDGMLEWKEEVKASISSRRKMMCLLSLMSSKYYERQELSDSDMKEFDPLFRPEEGAHAMGYYFLIDELNSLIKCSKTSSNLTHRYYAFKMIRYLKHDYLKGKWENYKSLPLDEQTLERGATIVAQWGQPEKHITYSSISSMLDDIAEQTKNLLREQYPTHSIFSLPARQFIIWKNSNIDDNQWSITETRQAMEALCKVLFEKLGFHGNSEMYYLTENSFIDCVLQQKRGIPITLAIVFESVARRLGIKCEPVSFPSHFLLRWKERYNIPESEAAESFYIDVFNGGQFLTKRNCPVIGAALKCPIEWVHLRQPATAVEMVSRMAENLKLAARQHTHLNGRLARLRSALELRFMVEPSDITTCLQLSRFYMIYQMDLTDLAEMFEKVQKKKTIPKKRVPGVKYAIGLIMRHKTKGYMCVITGWDLLCETSPAWVNEINLDELENGTDQPFYNVFVDDGSSRFAAQENLQLAPTPEWINNYEIGRYFSAFKGTHYVPNEEQARDYPEDEEVRNELLDFYEQNKM